MESSKVDGLYHREEVSSDSDCMYHCNYPGCTYETNRSAHLKRHERIHTNERPYKCPYCDYCASRSDHLRRHFKIHGKTVTSRYVRARPQPAAVKVEPVAQTVPVRRILPLPTYYPPIQPSYRTTTLDEGTALFIRFIQKCNLEAKKACLARS